MKQVLQGTISSVAPRAGPGGCRVEDTGHGAWDLPFRLPLSGSHVTPSGNRVNMMSPEKQKGIQEHLPPEYPSGGPDSGHIRQRSHALLRDYSPYAPLHEYVFPFPHIEGVVTDNPSQPSANTPIHPSPTRQVRRAVRTHPSRHIPEQPGRRSHPQDPGKAGGGGREIPTHRTFVQPSAPGSATLF